MTDTKSTVQVDKETGTVNQPVVTTVVNTVCTDFGPIDWDPADFVRQPDPEHPGHFTNGTLKRVRAHNAKWDAVCKH